MIRHHYWNQPKQSVAKRAETKPHNGRRANRPNWRIVKPAFTSRHATRANATVTPRRNRVASEFRILIRTMMWPFADLEETDDDNRKRRNKQKAIRRMRRGGR